MPDDGVAWRGDGDEQLVREGEEGIDLRDMELAHEYREYSRSAHRGLLRGDGLVCLFYVCFSLLLWIDSSTETTVSFKTRYFID